MSERINLEAFDTVRGGEAGIELRIKTPDGREWPGHIRIRGFDSETYQRTLDEQQRRLLASGVARRVPTVEDLAANELELAAALVIGWTLPIDWEGKPLDYSPANAQLLLKRFRWIREQVERAAGVRANFLPGSSTS